MIGRILAMGLLLATASPALAQEQSRLADGCPVTSPNAGNDQLPYWGNISPSDTPLDVWCRLQAVSGDYQVNILIGEDKALTKRRQGNSAYAQMFSGSDDTPSADRTFDVSFDGTARLSKQDFALMLQSLMPTSRRDVVTERGTAFAKALSKVVELDATTSPKTSSGWTERIDLHPGYPMAKELVFWEDLAIRMKPIRHEGVDWKLSVYFKPSAGQLFAALDGIGDLLTLSGWKDDVMRGHGASRGTCSEFVPNCTGRPDVVPLLTAWKVDRVVFETTDGQLATTAQRVLNDIVAQSQSEFIKRNTMNKFTLTEGSGEVQLSDGNYKIHAIAFPKGGVEGGTGRIAILYDEQARTRDKLAFANRLDEHTREFRERVFSTYARQAQTGNGD